MCNSSPEMNKLKSLNFNFNIIAIIFKLQVTLSNNHFSLHGSDSLKHKKNLKSTTPPANFNQRRYCITLQTKDELMFRRIYIVLSSTRPNIEFIWLMYGRVFIAFREQWEIQGQTVQNSISPIRNLIEQKKRIIIIWVKGFLKFSKMKNWLFVGDCK